MTKLQKVTCIILSVFFFAVLLLVPDRFFCGEMCTGSCRFTAFWRKNATSVPQREDPETYEKLVESNAKYLADMMKAENLQSGSDDMRENQETAVEKEKNRPEAHLSENEKPEEKTEESDRHLQEPQVTGEKKSSETEAIPTSKPEVSPVSGPTASPAVSSAASAQPALAQIQPAPVIDLAPEILADYDYLLNNFLL